MKNLLTTSIFVEKQAVAIGTVSGKVTKKGVQTGVTKSGTKYARVSLACGSTDYDVKHTEYVLGLNGKHINRAGDKADTYPLLFVDVVAFGKTAEFLEKNIKAGDSMRAIGTIQASEYNGNISVSLTASDFEKDFAQKSEGNFGSDSAMEMQNTRNTSASDDPFDIASDDLPF